MNHKEASVKKIAELYFNQELTPEDELAFEEHLLTCSLCRDYVQMLEETKEAMITGQQRKFREPVYDKGIIHSMPRRSLFTLRIAAGIILLIGIAGAGYLFFGRKSIRGTRLANEIKSEKQLFEKYRNDSAAIIIKPGKTGQEMGHDTQVLVSENFTPDPFYENLINSNFRNKAIKIIDPATDTVSKIPEFTWTENENDVLFLVIINNHEKKLFDKEIKNGEAPFLRIDPGLYYWQLQNHEENLFTGRFVYYPGDVR